MGAQNSSASCWLTITYRSRQSEGDHLIIINERHLRLVLKEYAAHYDQGRPHRSLDLVPPNGPPVRLVAPDRGRVKANPVLGGIHHEYQWEAACANRMYFEPPQEAMRQNLA